MPDFSHFVQDLSSPHYAWAHFPYVLFVLSMIMRRIVWLRGIAVVAGIARIFIRLLILYDPVTVMWETALVLINVGQLLLIWYDSRQHRTSADESALVSQVLPGMPRRTIRRFLRSAEWSDLPADSVLAQEGVAMPDLVFVADGAARVERAGAMVAVCSKGDFVGEMSFVTGGPATATVVAVKPMRVARFQRGALRDMLDHDRELRYALEASFNRNLIGKLSKSPTGAAPVAS